MCPKKITTIMNYKNVNLSIEVEITTNQCVTDAEEKEILIEEYYS